MDESCRTRIKHRQEPPPALVGFGFETVIFYLSNLYLIVNL
jgi:hypothetical protein